LGVHAPPEGARRDFFRCELLCQTVAKFILLYKFIQYIKWCKNDISFQTGWELQNELRTAALAFLVPKLWPINPKPCRNSLGINGDSPN